MDEQIYPKPVSGRRFAFAFLSWFLASVAVIGALFFALTPLGSGVGSGAVPTSISRYFYPLPLLAWVCLAAKTRSWLKNQTCHWIWIVTGIPTGIASAVFFFPVFFFYIAAVPLALYLTYWHARRYVTEVHQHE